MLRGSARVVGMDGELFCARVEPGETVIARKPEDPGAVLEY